MQTRQVLQNAFLCHSIIRPQHDSEIWGFDLHPASNTVRIEAARDSQFLQFVDADFQILQLKTAL